MTLTNLYNKNWTKFKSDLRKIRKENPDFKSEEQIRAIETFWLFFNFNYLFFVLFYFIFYLREKIINYYRYYSLLLSKAKYKWTYRKELKILSLEQMLQRLPIALAQVTAGNTSENLLNEIRQVTYSLHWAK